jgi:Tfp pilus assembly protein PilX
VKIARRSRIFPARGGTLMVTLLVTLLLGLVLASYLTLVRTEYVLTARSQAWQNALVLAEAGVEEALAQLNPGALTTNVTTGNGWSLSD